jgi:hypothetical protein
MATEVVLLLGLDPCAAALERLGQGGGSLAPVDHEALAQHLDSCEPCAAVAAAVSQLEEDLPRLCEIEPDPWFTRDVMRATLGRDRPAEGRVRARRMLASAGAWLREWWSSVVQRPRFALEAAYVLSMALLLAFRVDPVLAGRLESSAGGPRQATVAVSRVAVEMTAGVDQRLDALGAGVYRTVDGSLDVTSACFQRLLGAVGSVGQMSELGIGDLLQPPGWSRDARRSGSADPGPFQERTSSQQGEADE